MDEQAEPLQPKHSASLKASGLKGRLTGFKNRQASSTSIESSAAADVPGLAASSELPSTEERKKLLARMRAARSSANIRQTREEEEDPDMQSEDGQPSISTVAEEVIDQIEDTEEYYDLTGVDNPTTDVSHEAQSKGSKTAVPQESHPALVQPAAKLFLQPGLLDRGCHHGINCCVACLPLSCQSGTLAPASYFLRDERDVADEDWAQRRPEGESAENVPLLNVERDIPEFDDRDYTADEMAGVFRWWMPVLTPILLRGERVLPAVAALSTPYTLVSRTTQRILRDIHIARIQHRLHSESDQQALLRFLTQMQIFRPPDNPVDYSFSQPVLPPVSRSFGGQLGQWGSTATSLQRIGPIPGSLTRLAGGGTLLKLFLFQIVLTDHPLMNGEERGAAELREMFSQYAVMFEQKSVEHLAHRINVLSAELRKLLAVPDDATAEDDEHALHLRNCYHDLLELIPALHECSRLLHSLTSSVYAKWREVVECRRRQSFACTQVAVKVKRLHSNLSPVDLLEREEGADARMAEEASGGHDSSMATVGWEELRVALRHCVEDLVTAQSRLFNPRPAAPEGEQLRPSASAAALAAVGAKEDEQQRMEKRVRELKLVTSAANELLASNQLLPRFVMQINETYPVSSYNVLSEAEMGRRRDIQNCVYKCAVKINGNVVTTIKYNRDLLRSAGETKAGNAVGWIKYPQFLINFKKYLEIKLLHLPTDVSVDVFVKIRNKYVSRYQFLSTVHLALPQKHSKAALFGVLSNNRGVFSADRHTFAHNLVSRYGGYAFSSDLCKVSDYVRKSHLDHLTALFREDESDHRRTSGTLYCAVDFDPLLPAYQADHATHALDGHDDHTLALIPAPYRSDDHRVFKIKAGDNTIFSRMLRSGAGGLLNEGSSSGGAGGGQSATGYNVIYDISRENDFQQLLPALQQIDANNPSNDYLIYLKSKKLHNNENNVFRLQGLDHSEFFSFRPDRIALGPDDAEAQHLNVNYLKVKMSLRAKLLRLRCRKPYLFSAPVPLFDHLISANVAWTSLLHREYPTDNILHYAHPAADDDEAGEDGARAVDDVSKKKYRITSFLQKVRNSYVILNRNLIKRNFATANIVLEIDYVPQFLEVHRQLLYRKRALKPQVVRHDEKAVNITHCDLLVQVVGAKNVPVRIDGTTVASPGASTAAGAGAPALPASPNRPGMGATHNPATEALRAALKPKQHVRSFVEVKFQENILHTITLEGSHPFFKHSLSVPFLPPHNDFSPMYLEQVRDLVYFTLFDEVHEDDAERGGFMEGEVTTRREKRYLGSFSIPFATLYARGRVEGVFRMDTPLINVGYQPSQGLGSTVAASGVQAMAMNPALSTPHPNAADVPRSTVEMVGDLLQLFVTDCLPTEAGQAIMQVVSLPFQAPPTIVDAFQASGEYISKATLRDLEHYASDARTTYVKLLLTLTPRLPSPPTQAPQLLPSTVYREDRPYVHYTQFLLDQLAQHSAHTAERTYKFFVTNSSGLQILLSRYLTPMAPPPGYTTLRSLLHLVSSIPFMKDTQAFLGSIDLWCTVTQFWDMGAGDEEEHAVVLYNYLRHLLYAPAVQAQPEAAPRGRPSDYRSYPTDKEVQTERVFLAVGSAVPEGETVYVVLRDTPFVSSTPPQPQSIVELVAGLFAKSDDPYRNSYAPSNYLVINPCTGHVYSAMDPYCPLKEIHLLATPYNVFANVQPSASPQFMAYDVFNPQNFRPFFGAKMPSPSGGLSTIQDESPLRPTDSGLAAEIERGVYQALRNNVRRWRSKRYRGTTTFHPEVSNVVTDMLPQLEHWKTHGTDSHRATVSGGSAPEPPAGLTAEAAGLELLHAELESRMRNILRTRIFRGCPLNLPFTDVDEVVAKVKTLCIHEARHPEVQFVLAVRAFPLFNGVVSLWVFFGTLESIMPGSRLLSS